MNWLKSIFFIWIPVGIVASILHHLVGQGDIDGSSYFFGMMVGVTAIALDDYYGY